MPDIPTLVTLAGKAGPAVEESSIPLVRCADCPAGLDRKCVHAIITLRVLTACKEWVSKSGPRICMLSLLRAVLMDKYHKVVITRGIHRVKKIF